MDNCGVLCTGARQHWLFGVQPWGAEKMGQLWCVGKQAQCAVVLFSVGMVAASSPRIFLRPNSILAVSNAMRGPINHCCTLGSRSHRLAQFLPHRHLPHLLGQLKSGRVRYEIEWPRLDHRRNGRGPVFCPVWLIPERCCLLARPGKLRCCAGPGLQAQVGAIKICSTCVKLFAKFSGPVAARIFLCSAALEIKCRVLSPFLRNSHDKPFYPAGNFSN